MMPIEHKNELITLLMRLDDIIQRVDAGTNTHYDACDLVRIIELMRERFIEIEECKK